MLARKQCFSILCFVFLIAHIDDRGRFLVSSEETDGLKSDIPLIVDPDLGKHADHLRTDDEAVQRKMESNNTFFDDISEEGLRKLSSGAEVHNFQTEENRMMKLIINSLYKNKEIFLRELISNGSDALDKIRHRSLTDPEVLQSNPDMSIWLSVDKERKLLHIYDSGIGMTEKQLIELLGTLAKSHSSEFQKKNGEEKENPDEASNLIGQFGVGFYSVFLVADVVYVTSKHNDDDQHIWVSDSLDFKVIRDPRGNTLRRGTTVTLQLKEEAFEFLDISKIKFLATKYSGFINYPIYLRTPKEVEVEDPSESLPKEVEDDKTDEDAVEKKEDEPVVEDEDGKTEKTKAKITETVMTWEHLNDVKSIWQRKPSDVSHEEVVEFYKTMTKKNEEPLCHVHFSAEGDVNFRSIVFLPKTAPVSYSTNLNRAKNDNIKLYVRRVFISDQVELTPSYLNFVSGIVDSDDLTLNISREELQQSKFLKTIKKKLIRKILDTLKAMDPTDYEAFWREFGTNIKFGMTEDSLNRGRLSKLLRFYSTHTTIGEARNFTSLEDYVSRAKKDQKVIYYVSERNVEEAKKAPFAEKLLLKGYEILFLVDPVDQFCLQNIPEFEGMKFQNAAKEGLDVGSSKSAIAKREARDKEFQPLIRWLEDSFSDKIIKVILSERLVETPMVFVAAQWGYDGNMEKISKAQAYQKVGGDTATVHFANMKRKMEINPGHPVIKDLLHRVKMDKSDADLREFAEICVDVALIRSGYDLRDPIKFTGRIETMVRGAMDIPKHARVEEDIDDFSDTIDEADKIAEEKESDDVRHEEL